MNNETIDNEQITTMGHRIWIHQPLFIVHSIDHFLSKRMSQALFL